LYYIQKLTKSIGLKFKLLEETIGINLGDLGLRNGFADVVPNTQATKVKIVKLDIINIRSFCGLSSRK
jgi:hypothetical protein